MISTYSALPGQLKTKCPLLAHVEKKQAQVSAEVHPVERTPVASIVQNRNLMYGAIQAEHMVEAKKNESKEEYNNSKKPP